MKEVWTWRGQTQSDVVPYNWVAVVVMLLVSEDGEYLFRVHVGGPHDVFYDPTMGALPYRCECGRPLHCCHRGAVLSAIAARRPQ